MTPILGYLSEMFQTYKPWEEGILPSIHIVPRGGAVYLLLLEQGEGQRFCRSVALLAEPRGDRARLPAICMLVLTLTWNDQRGGVTV